jgi:hypothetical protein
MMRGMVIDIQHSERRSPAPNNRPGHLHVDGVHQGDHMVSMPCKK